MKFLSYRHFRAYKSQLSKFAESLATPTPVAVVCWPFLQVAPSSCPNWIYTSVLPSCIRAYCPRPKKPHTLTLNFQVEYPFISNAIHGRECQSSIKHKNMNTRVWANSTPMLRKQSVVWACVFFVFNTHSGTADCMTLRSVRWAQRRRETASDNFETKSTVYFQAAMPAERHIKFMNMLWTAKAYCVQFSFVSKKNRTRAQATHTHTRARAGIQANINDIRYIKWTDHVKKKSRNSYPACVPSYENNQTNPSFVYVGISGGISHVENWSIRFSRLDCYIM